MRAVVDDATARPTSCGSRRSSGPCRKTTSCSSGSTRRPSTAPTRTIARGTPFITRFFTGPPPAEAQDSRAASSPARSRQSARAVTRVRGRRPGLRRHAAGAGAHAEFMCIRASAPSRTCRTGMTLRGGGGGPDGACIALACLRRVGLRKGKRILVYGASGSIGTAAVQLAQLLRRRTSPRCATRRTSSSCARSAPIG